MTNGQEELGRAVESVMKKFHQPEHVRKQYLKLVENLAKANYDESDLNRMIDAIVVPEEEEE